MATRERNPFGVARRMVELPSEDVETIKDLKVLWGLTTDSAVLRRLLAEHGRPALWSAVNNVDAMREQFRRIRSVTVEQRSVPRRVEKMPHAQAE
jgi:hypothetical protein